MYHTWQQRRFSTLHKEYERTTNPCLQLLLWLCKRKILKTNLNHFAWYISASQVCYVKNPNHNRPISWIISLPITPENNNCIHSGLLCRAALHKFMNTCRITWRRCLKWQGSVYTHDLVRDVLPFCRTLKDWTKLATSNLANELYFKFAWEVRVFYRIRQNRVCIFFFLFKLGVIVVLLWNNDADRREWFCS